MGTVQVRTSSAWPASSAYPASSTWPAPSSINVERLASAWQARPGPQRGELRSESASRSARRAAARHVTMTPKISAAVS